MGVVIICTSSRFQPLRIPLFLSRVAAGFPSPAIDYVERLLDLNELCIRRPAATYFVRAGGDSMIGVGIFPGDILVVDRSIEAKHYHVVIACVHGEMTCKRLETEPLVRLVPENSRYSPISIPEGTELEVFGVVTNFIHSLLAL